MNILWHMKRLEHIKINYRRKRTTKPRSSNSRSRSASWSLRPCRRPRLASAIDGGICNRTSVWPRRPLAAAAWAWAWAWSCWHVAYILNIVAIKKTPSTSQSYKQKEDLISHKPLKQFGVPFSQNEKNVYPLFTYRRPIPENLATSDESWVSWITGELKQISSKL